MKQPVSIFHSRVARKRHAKEKVFSSRKRQRTQKRDLGKEEGKGKKNWGLHSCTFLYKISYYLEMCHSRNKDFFFLLLISYECNFHKGNSLQNHDT